MENQRDIQDVTVATNSRGSTLAYLIAGLGIGAAMSLLLAPKSGAKTRQWIANKCLDGLDSANRSVRHTRKQVKSAIDQGQEKISEAIGEARESMGKS